MLGNEPLSAANLFSVAGKHALVTGGSRGIGLMIAKAFVSNGAIVYISARKKEACDKCAEDLTHMGPGKCISLPADLTSDAACRKLASAVANETDKLDILVNNAGATWGSSLEDFPEEAWRKVMDLNVASVFNLTRACLTLLKAASRGASDPARVINISSINGHSTDRMNNNFSYSASKAAVSHLTKILATSLTPDGITVNALAPGFFPSKVPPPAFWSHQLGHWLQLQGLPISEGEAGSGGTGEAGQWNRWVNRGTGEAGSGGRGGAGSVEEAGARWNRSFEPGGTGRAGPVNRVEGLIPVEHRVGLHAACGTGEAGARGTGEASPVEQVRLARWNRAIQAEQVGLQMTAFLMDGDEVNEAVLQQYPIGRVGCETDMAGAVLFLSSRAGAFISGSIIPLDGGYLVAKSNL
ncbi:hypothetical protein CYMTET_5361 [Cymbomonas tetramitiformis]|uniref:Uncharacterized protein n=1 Tax=Cymbomonas tetramitiformis TaxID=36881 RepID=A0AAE0LJ63_9CHLO|nr:hypothetical protein CYMTET_5361 [Cymbomonas tetramitiformis]